MRRNQPDFFSTSKRRSPNHRERDEDSRIIALGCSIIFIIVALSFISMIFKKLQQITAPSTLSL